MSIEKYFDIVIEADVAICGGARLGVIHRPDPKMVI